MRKREIVFNRDTFYDSLTTPMPNAQRVANVLVDNQIGAIKGPESVQALGRELRELFDSSYAAIYKGEKKRTTHVLDRTTGLLSHLFYAHTLTMKPSIWVAQVMQYVNGLRSMGYTGLNPLQAMAAAGKGLATVLRGKYVDRDLVNAVMWVSQNTNTLHPQLTNELTKLSVGRDPNTTLNQMIRLLSGETFSGASDSLSRFMTFVTYYHAYKDAGMSGKALWEKAAAVTDENMFQYGRNEQPAVYKHMGIIGEQATPLKTFAHGQLGLLVADAKHFLQQPNIKTAGPLALSVMIASIMGGAISMPIVAEYELLRKALIAMKIIQPETFPSAVEWALTQSPSISHGVISGATGVDIGASMRYNSLIGGIATAESAWGALFPTLGFSTGLVAPAYQRAFGNITESEERFLEKKLTPKGVLWGTKDMLMDEGYKRKFVPMGPGGDAMVKQTPADVAAAFAGTRSTNEARASSQNLLNVEKTQLYNERKKKAIDFLIEGQEKKGVDLLIKAKVDPKTINNLLQSDVLRRNKPVLERFVTNKQGIVSSYDQKRKLLDMVGYIEAENANSK